MTISRRAILVGAGAAFARKAKAQEGAMHIVLLGDSVIDNKAYVGGGPDVPEQIRMLAPRDCTVTNLARDGAVTRSVIDQLGNLPSDATHLVISVGGNDALQNSGILESSAQSVSDVLLRLAEIQDRFREIYREMLDVTPRPRLPTAICTIYDPRFPQPLRRRIGALALSVINDVISREAFSRRLTLVDLRVMFDDDADFANPIEPSVAGGLKLARAIHHFASLQPQVVT